MSRVVDAVESTAALFLLAIALLVAGNVILRDLLSIQVPDWFDFSRLLQAIALMWGIAVATYRGGHIAVDLLWETCGPRGRRWLDIIATTVVLLALAPMAWMLWVRIGAVGTQTTSDLRIPLVYFYAVAGTGAVAASVLAAFRMLRVAARRDL